MTNPSNHHAAPLEPRRLAILGDGQMGLVMSAILREGDRQGTGDKPERISLWGFFEQDIRRLAASGTSPRLPGFRLDPSIVVTHDPDEALAGADLVVIAIPTQHIRGVLTAIGSAIPPGAGLVSIAKGIEIGTGLLPTGVLAQCLPDHRGPVADLSGPTIAAELAERKPATMIAASSDAAFAETVQRVFSTPWLRIYTSDDVVGVELAGAAKNVIAIAAGVVDGMGLGANAKSALLARGLAEITRLGVAMGANPETFFGIAGVGDLATTCFSPFGRNRSCGEALGKGEPLDDYLARTQSVVEGVATAKAIVELAGALQVDMPIAQTVHAVLYEGLSAKQGIAQLMARPLKAERVG
ncbi:MAG: NAD(P)-dependent glycerol-3-phosphate dehydrogenase [Phycisphaeraceae bacterium]|nr:NAD(P)-dependent glycerol-3-phosphate dehydrogenase [Phycisphaeraceae bacterium]